MYILEGNIGAGKSTFLKLVAQHLPYVTIALEPVNNWQHETHGESLLFKFYDNPQRWAYTMETFTMACRVKEHLLEQRCASSYHIAERSIYSGHYCFALNGYENGFMTKLEWNIYNEWFNFLVREKCKPPTGFIYLKTDPTISYERIQKRGRASEKTVPIEYLRQIESCHERFLIKKENVRPELKDIPVLELDCNQDFETNQDNLQKHLVTIDEFILTINADQNRPNKDQRQSQA